MPVYSTRFRGKFGISGIFPAPSVWLSWNSKSEPQRKWDQYNTNNSRERRRVIHDNDNKNNDETKHVLIVKSNNNEELSNE